MTPTPNWYPFPTNTTSNLAFKGVPKGTPFSYAFLAVGVACFLAPQHFLRYNEFYTVNIFRNNFQEATWLLYFT